VLGDQLVGTASLDGHVVRTIFVLPNFQSQGVGRLLMAKIDQEGRDTGVQVLAVPSSVTAEPFYTKLGFKALRDSYHKEERTIIMERNLREP
jgi:GNAT superfamily N-acetyltransferase